MSRFAGNTRLSQIVDSPPIGARQTEDAINTPTQPQAPWGIHVPAVAGGASLNLDASNSQVANVAGNTTTAIINNINIDGYNPKRLVITEFDMTVAQDPRTPLLIPNPGTFFEFNFAGAATSRIRVRLDSQSAPPLKMLLGQSKSGIPFARIYLDWDVDTAAVAGDFAQFVISADAPFDRIDSQG